MRYWDSSALLPLLVGERQSGRMEQLLRDDPAVVTWWATPVECVSALARLERTGMLSSAGMRLALTRLTAASAGWMEIPASTAVRDQAIRLLRLHPLRAADALQLAAALIASNFQPDSLEFISLDGHQSEAAEREGFRVPAGESLE
jgi:predicted nucleic acid-binding protein